MEKSAFEEQYRMVYQDMYRFALYTLRNQADAEDAVAEAVMDAWKGLGGLREDEAFRKWIFKILSIKCKRRQKEYSQLVVSLEAEEESFYQISAYESDLAAAQDVRNAFWQLDIQERMIVSLSVFGGYNSKEIGDALMLKSTTVRSKLSRGLSKMQVSLEA